jgi:hypothetical protein
MPIGGPDVAEIPPEKPIVCRMSRLSEGSFRRAAIRVAHHFLRGQAWRKEALEPKPLSACPMGIESGAVFGIASIVPVFCR